VINYRFRGHTQADDETHAVRDDQGTACGDRADLQALDADEITCVRCLVQMAWEITAQIWKLEPEPDESAYANLAVSIATLKLTNSEELECYRCKRTVPTSTLEPTTAGLFKCSPDASGYDECMRLYNTV
jgi:hypothetical protein